ncbi:hypothetical protein LPJ61_003056 [Coemansia biformis]|uniref:Uncharacterized protein n=1 Tax=Coemansia biformis TaxID=1286918 RepID=A0A9W7Y780_9FUNG|nr:hypothetical protein LPJ61_003056 [Coemansia biformis]
MRAPTLAALGLRLGRPLLRQPGPYRLVAARALSTRGPEDDERAYVEAAKQQMRSYQKWRQHFKWRREHITDSLRDYALWSLLGLLAYYTMTKRHELLDYEADSFVAIDKLEGRLHALDPHNRLLDGTTRSSHDPAPTAAPPRSEPSSPSSSRPQGGSSSPSVFY